MQVGERAVDRFYDYRSEKEKVLYENRFISLIFSKSFK